jgi:acyl-CoA synthetase (AMP-forming)/AMP-acid ligase II
MLLHDPLRDWADRRPDHPALWWVERDRRLSYAEAVVEAESAAGLLSDTGVSPGERVTIFANNGLDYLVAMLGCWRLGAIAALVNVNYANELEAYLADHDPTAIVFTHEHHHRVRAAATAVGTKPRLLCLDGPLDGVTSWPDGIAARLSAPTDPADEDAIAHLSYTSGTSGRPKGACLAHGPTARATNCIAERLQHGRDDVSFGPTALSSSYQLVANLMPTLHRGGTVCVTGAWDRTPGWPVLEGVRATILAANPSVLAGLLDHHRRDPNPAPHLRLAVSGGAPLSTDLKRAWRDEIGVPVAESYGQSELGGFVGLGRATPAPDDELDAVGAPLPDKEVRILDSCDEPVDCRTIGEIVIRGGFMVGHWGRPDQTAEALRGGWLHTGDLGIIDERGLVHIRGRSSERMRIGDQDWFPRDLESALESHPEVLQAAVVGVTTPDRTLVPVAFVLPRPGASPQRDSLLDHLASRLDLAVDRLHVDVVDALPLTPTGKIAKAQLRDQHPLARSAADEAG